MNTAPPFTSADTPGADSDHLAYLAAANTLLGAVLRKDNLAVQAQVDIGMAKLDLLVLMPRRPADAAAGQVEPAPVGETLATVVDLLEKARACPTATHRETLQIALVTRQIRELMPAPDARS